jgi:hypothetical protein
LACAWLGVGLGGALTGGLDAQLMISGLKASQPASISTLGGRIALPAVKS